MCFKIISLICRHIIISSFCAQNFFYVSLGYRLVATEKNASEIVFAGKVEFYADDGKWYILHDSNWTKVDQDVLCKDLLFPGALRKTDQHPKGENDSVACKNYTCFGRESYLIDCNQSDVDYRGCGNKTVAAVECKHEGQWFFTKFS